MLQLSLLLLTFLMPFLLLPLLLLLLLTRFGRCFLDGCKSCRCYCRTC